MKTMNYIKELLFGVRAQGQRVSEPMLPKERPMNDKDFNQWSKKFNVGARYGHRGSFYHN
jgi:hypothetical protein